MCKAPAFLLIATVLTLEACASHGSFVPTSAPSGYTGEPTQPQQAASATQIKPVAPASMGPNQRVAVMADTEQELLSQINRARAAGLQPQFIVVSAPLRTYTFPVYASIARSVNALLVVAYNSLYVFQLDHATVHYTNSPVEMSYLPVVAARHFDARAKVAKETGKFKFGIQMTKEALCPDCVALVRRKAAIGAITKNWKTQSDPWQRTPNYVAWVPTPTMAPKLKIIPPNCFSGCSSRSYYYYIVIGYIGIGSGGSGATPTPTPIELKITSNSLPSNSIGFQLTGPGTGTVTVEEIVNSRPTNRQIGPYSAGSYVIHYFNNQDGSDLALGEHTQLKLTWNNTYGAVYDSKVETFDVLGNWVQTQYNIPLQSTCTGSQESVLLFNPNGCNSSASTFVSQFVTQANRNGTGEVASNKYCSVEWACGHSTVETDFDFPVTPKTTCQTVPDATTVATYDINNAKGTGSPWRCGDNALQIRGTNPSEITTKKVEDNCPGCSNAQFGKMDNFTTSGACSGVPSLPNAVTVRMR